VKGSMATATSRKTEFKLPNDAKASLEQLRLDYKDFLRQRRLPFWDKKDPRQEKLFEKRCATADDVAKWAREVHNREPGGLGAARVCFRRASKQKGPTPLPA
jgi:hypothetical protein